MLSKNYNISDNKILVAEIMNSTDFFSIFRKTVLYINTDSGLYYFPFSRIVKMA